MTEEKIIVKDQNPVYTQSTNAYRRAGDNISWGAILAGVVTFIGLLIVFSMLIINKILKLFSLCGL